MHPPDRQSYGNGDMAAAGDRASLGHLRSREELERTGRWVPGRTRVVGGAAGCRIRGRALAVPSTWGHCIQTTLGWCLPGKGLAPALQLSQGVMAGWGGCSEISLRCPRLFGGLLRDIRRKAPWYGSDFSDALHPQCLSAVLYIYLATVTNAITFGGMLGDATTNMQVGAAVGCPAPTPLGLAPGSPGCPPPTDARGASSAPGAS